MSSKIDINVVVHSEEANKNVDQLDENIKKTKTNAEKPTKIKIDVDDAKKSATGLKDALQNVKDAGLGELSQKAAELGGQIDGVFGDIAEVALKSAAAFGPVGVAITAVAAALAFAKQAYDEHKAAVDLNDAKTEELRNTTEALGAAYPSVSAAINGARTATEAHTRATIENNNVQQERLRLLGLGFNTQQVTQYATALQEIGKVQNEYREAVQRFSEAQVRNTIESGNAAQQQEVLGLTFTHSADQQVEAQNRLDAAIVAVQRTRQQVANFTQREYVAAQNRLADANQAVVRGGGIVALGEARQAIEDLRAKTDSYELAVRNLNRTYDQAVEAEARLRDQRVMQGTVLDGVIEITGRVHTATTTLTAAQREQNAIERLNSIEALRVAREVFDQRGREIDITEQLATTRMSVAHAIAMEADAEVRYARSGTVEHRTQLITALNTLNQATAAQARLQEQVKQREAATVQASADVLRSQQQQQLAANRNLFTQGEQFASQERQRLQNIINLTEAQRLLAQAQTTQAPSMVASVIDPNREASLQLQRDEAEATHQLTLANQALADSLREIENARGITTPEMIQRRIQATQGVTNATNTLTRAQQANAANTQGPVKKSLEGLKDGLAGTASGLLSTAIAAGIAGESIGVAVQKKLSESLAALAEESAVQALFETAKGFAALFMHPPEAAAHFTSAGIYAATAAVAGVGAVALAPATAPNATAAGAAPGAAAAPARNEAVGEKAPANVTINLNAFQSNDAAQALIVRSLREAGYNNRGIRGVR